MAGFSRIEVAMKMQETVLVPVFYSDSIDTCKGVLQACYAGGIRVFEFTNRGDYAHHVFRELNQYAKVHMPEMILGAGSVMDPGTAALYIQEGANFIVSPFLKESIAPICHARKILWIPGCATLTEIARAEELGAEIVKAFPGNILTPAFIEALKGPMPWTKIMVTGGVEPTEESIGKWLKAGACALGLGSQLFSKDIINNKQYDVLEQRIKEVFQKIKK